MLAELGFRDIENLELINGDLIDRMGKRRPHILWQHRILWWLQSVFGPEFVESESPTDVSIEDNPTSEPEPDLKVTAKPIEAYLTNPPPGDVRLIVEVSDSTLNFDLTVKAALYARAAMIEYWVVDIPGSRLIVHRDPSQGVYASVIAYGFEDELTPLAAPDARFCMAKL